MEQREVCAEGRKERPGQLPRDLPPPPHTLRPCPAAPSRAGTPRRPRPHSGRTGGRGKAPPPSRRQDNRGPRTRHLVVTPSSSVSRGSGATWSGASREAGGRAREGRREGGTGRRRRTHARASARGGPRVPDWAAGGAAPGHRGWAGALGSRPRPASPVRSGAASAPSRLPRSQLGPAARAHTLGQRRPQAESSDGGAQAAAGRDPVACAGKRSRAGPPAAQFALLGHRPRPPTRGPQPFSAGVPFAVPRPLPWAARTSEAVIRGPVEAEVPPSGRRKHRLPAHPGPVAK